MFLHLIFNNLFFQVKSIRLHFRTFHVKEVLQKMNINISDGKCFGCVGENPGSGAEERRRNKSKND